MTGPGRPRRTDARYVDSKGYVQVRVGDSYVPEQRLVMMAMLGRDLLPGERVQHRDRVRHHNDPPNLELRVGSAILGEDAVDLACPNCGLAWLDEQPTALRMSVDEVAARIVSGTWSVMGPEGPVSDSRTVQKTHGVPVRLVERKQLRSRPVLPGQERLFDLGAAA